MKTFVVTVLDDVVAKNGKDPEALQLIEAARTYGKVETLEAVTEGIRKEYEEVIRNLRIQLDACAEHGVTPTELEVLRLIRKKSAIEAQDFENNIADLKALVKSLEENHEATLAKIRSVVASV